MYQFIHIETYARKASTKQKPSKPKAGKKSRETTSEKEKKPKQDVRGVIAEAVRDPGDCPHVASPEPPRYLLGDDAVMRGMQSDIERNLDLHHARMGGRKLRSDAHVLLAGIASFPRGLQTAEPDTYEKWEGLTVEWLNRKYGQDLRAVLMHDDEEHPHIHFYVYSPERVNAKELHDGYAAAAHLPVLTKEAGIAHADAMRAMQSSYYAEVAHECGLLRDGPKRRRESRASYKARQREERERVALGKQVTQVHADLLNGAATEAKRAADLRREAERAQQAALAAVEDTQLGRQELQRSLAAVDAEWSEAREARAEAARLKVDAERKLTTLDKQASAMERARIAADEAKAEAALATAARDQEANQLRTEKARAVAVGKRYEGRLAGLGAVEDVRALVRKPELVAMLDFIDQNPGARKVLDIMKADPEMALHIEHGAEALASIGNGAQPAWDSSEASAAADYLASVQMPAKTKPVHDSGMDFGL